MVKLAGLISTTATALGIPEATLAIAFRSLRESGLMTTGGRGRAAPDMTYLDQARLVIWALVTDKPAMAEHAAVDFGRLICTEIEPAPDRSPEAGAREINPLQKAYKFEDAVAELLRVFSEDTQLEYFQSECFESALGVHLPPCEISVHVSSLTAIMYWRGDLYHFSDADQSLLDNVVLDAFEQDVDAAEMAEKLTALEAENQRYVEKAARYKSNIKITRGIMTNTIDSLATAFRASVDV
ncbi:hypothetical protein [Aureimonas glaciei]|uniref:Uncharacterized protein n=1 Tax=Aureimonas glaciei TaxID=1776957 RepID=A0A916YEP2_9HYPH|nr:hypothetical protein [Aureimonas glaciei]GGD42486.1 hypothetical protein GCM10011335_51480 [Aureimonas glaciei]